MRVKASDLKAGDSIVATMGHDRWYVECVTVRPNGYTVCHIDGYLCPTVKTFTPETVLDIERREEKGNGIS